MQKIKFLLPLLLFSALLFGQRFPERPSPPQLVNDFADILSDQEEAQLEQKLVNYSDTTSTEITVVTIQSLGGEDPNLYAAELGTAWGVGRGDKDNGLVFLVSSGDREMAIQNGYGLEAVLTDALTKRIIEQYVLPEFREEDYYAGIDSGTDQIFKLLAGKFEGKGNREGSRNRGLPIIGMLVIMAIVFFVVRKKGGGGHGGYHRRGGGVWIGGMAGGLGGSSGGFGGGGGGGFGGFGGGSFGGGGASGSW